jgi:hypothetical protein
VSVESSVSVEISDAKAAETILNLANKRAEQNDSRSAELLEVVIKIFPLTPAAKEAAELLRMRLP